MSANFRVYNDSGIASRSAPVSGSVRTVLAGCLVEQVRERCGVILSDTNDQKLVTAPILAGSSLIKMICY